MTLFIQGIFVFLAVFATDICWATFIRNVGLKDPIRSASWAVLLYLTGTLATISVVGNTWMIIPATLGAAVGTFIAVKWEKT